MKMYWPPKELSPNARVHWGARGRATKKYRADAHNLALSDNLHMPDADKVRVHLTFHPPSHRRYDADNLMASCKGLLDGLADALKVNDHRFVPTMQIGSVDPDKLGFVIVELREV